MSTHYTCLRFFFFRFESRRATSPLELVVSVHGPRPQRSISEVPYTGNVNPYDPDVVYFRAKRPAVLKQELVVLPIVAPFPATHIIAPPTPIFITHPPTQGVIKLRLEAWAEKGGKKNAVGWGRLCRLEQGTPKIVIGLDVGQPFAQREAGERTV